MNDKIFIDPYEGIRTRPHPAKFSNILIDEIGEIIPENINIICDPMAGIGKVINLGDSYTYYLNELEPEWANQIPLNNNVHVQIGDAKYYKIPENSCIVTSPPYGNRMADFFYSHRPESMKGRYAGDLGRALTEGSTASLKFGNKYEVLITTIYQNLFNQMNINQYFILNISNFISKGIEQNVIGFYLKLFEQNNFRCDFIKPVKTPRDRGRGANSDVRVSHEFIFRLKKCG